MENIPRMYAAESTLLVRSAQEVHVPSCRKVKSVLVARNIRRTEDGQILQSLEWAKDPMNRFGESMMIPR
jgi:hypothetical protein